MANKAPFFITSANAKIKINGVTLAYVTDFNYSIKVNHQEMRILGVYEHDTVEPTSYGVNGSFTLIRYVEGAVKRAKNRGESVPNGSNDLGNGVGSWTKSAATLAGRIVRGQLFDGRANEALDPGALSTGAWFDIEFYQKTPGGQTGVARIRKCRITSAESRLSRGAVLTQTFSFVANAVDEDSFIANPSDSGQTTA